MKTIKEQIEDYISNDGYVFDPMMEKYEYDQCIREAVEHGISLAQRWIDVSERLPEHLTDVLIKLNQGQVDIGCYYPEEYWGMTNPSDDKTVTHWRPIDITIE